MEKILDNNNPILTIIFNLILICAYFNQSIVPEELVLGKVDIIKGKATKLVPHALHSTQVKLDDIIKEDTSILTYEKSYVRISFDDGSKLSIGPNSKIVIAKSKRNSPKVWGLLKGNLRATMNKALKGNKEGEYTHIVKTRTAALGVRGTTFQSIYNPDNKNTTLVTLRGEVEIATVPKKTTTENLEQQLKMASKISVLEGNFSAVQITSLEKDVSVAATKINPEQYKVMSQNDPTNIVESGEIIDRSSSDDVISDLRPGGMIDFQTGLYIRPDENAIYDEKNKVYVSSVELGKINQDDGNYIPPSGLKVDSLKGLVVDDKAFSQLSIIEKNEREKLLLENNSYNDKIVDFDDDKNLASISYNFQIRYSGLYSKMHFLNKELKTDTYHDISLGLTALPKNHKIYFQAEFGRSHIDIVKNNSFTIIQNTNELFHANIAVAHSLYANFDVSLGLKWDERLLPRSSQFSDTLEIHAKSFTNILVELKYRPEIIKSIGFYSKVAYSLRIPGFSPSIYSRGKSYNILFGPWYKMDDFLCLQFYYNGIIDQIYVNDQKYKQTSHALSLELMIDF